MTMRWQRWWVFAAVICSVASPLAAQELRGTLTLPDSSTPAVGVIVVATATGSGETVGRTLTGSTGLFMLRVAPGREFVVRALRIGQRPTVLGTFTLSLGETKSGRYVLSGAAVTLDRVDVVSDRVCRIRDNAGAAQVTALYDEARKAITATQLTSGSGGRLTAQWTLESQLTSLRGVPLGDPVGQTFNAPTEQPFVSLPPDSLAKVGYLQTEGPMSWVYQAPDANVLLSDAFVTGNCFRAVPWDRDSSDWVGLGFSPVRNLPRGMVGIEGTLWIDRRSAELRRLEYTYVNVPRALAGTPAGGQVEFLRIPSGAWLVNHWEIRMPRPVEYQDRRFASSGGGWTRLRTVATTRITSMEVASGTVREVRRGGAIVYRAPISAVTAVAATTGTPVGLAELCHEGGQPRPMVWGRLRDSTGTVLAGVDIVASWPVNVRWVADWQRGWDTEELRTRTQANGLWYVCGVPTDRRVNVRADLPNRAGAPALARVVGDSMPVEVQLGAVRAAATGSIEGVVVDSLVGGVRWASAEVRVSGTALRAQTDAQGQFRIADVPVGRHEVVVSDMRLTALGLPEPVAEVIVPEPGATARVGLASRGREAVFRQLCGRAPIGDEGVLLGEVMDTRGTRRADVEVVGDWARLIVAVGANERTDHRVADTTDAHGRYVLCGVPMAGALEAGGGGSSAAVVMSGDVTLRAAGRDVAAGPLTVRLDAQVALRRDLIVGVAALKTTLTGRVLDEQGHPLRDAMLVVEGLGLSARSDSLGRWQIAGVPLASTQLRVRALRYLPRTIDLTPELGRIVVGDVRLSPVPQELAAVTVEGRRMSRDRLGYEERKKLPVGTFLDEAWLTRQPRVTPRAVLTMISLATTAVDTARDAAPGRLKIAFRAPRTRGGDMVGAAMATCFPRWFVDGADWGHPGAVEEQRLLQQAKRIEAYRAIEMPAEFMDFTGCGSIVIWTTD